MDEQTKTAIREAGGIVHSDGNIFFTNADQFKSAAAALPAVEFPVIPALTWCNHCGKSYYGCCRIHSPTVI